MAPKVRLSICRQPLLVFGCGGTPLSIPKLSSLTTRLRSI
jgi:hypothetical protein